MPERNQYGYGIDPKSDAFLCPHERGVWQDRRPIGIFAQFRGSQDFYRLLLRCAELHHTKNQDYATADDPFKNFRAGERIGVAPHRMALLRLLEKVERVINVAARGDVATKDETIEDTLLDMSALSLITLVLWQEGKDNE